MTKLYGEEYSEEVFNRLESLDSELNMLIQEGPYESFWSREGLSIRDKSLATVAALVGMGRDEQTQIHMTGFLNSGGTVDELRNLLIHLSVYCGWPATMTAFSNLKMVLKKREE